jgi:hypothetical protein
VERLSLLKKKFHLLVAACPSWFPELQISDASSTIIHANFLKENLRCTFTTGSTSVVEPDNVSSEDKRRAEKTLESSIT